VLHVRVLSAGPVRCRFGKSEDAMGAEQNKLLVRRLVEGINSGSLEVLDEVAYGGFAGRRGSGSGRSGILSPTSG
jgi:hypothetical protein